LIVVAIAARQTFVIELPGTLLLAFEAACEEEALALSNTPWFRDALAKYLCFKSSRSTADVSPRIRPATKEETAVYRDYAREFAEMADCFLLAPVS
jgi:hypothetical protein